MTDLLSDSKNTTFSGFNMGFCFIIQYISPWRIIDDMGPFYLMVSIRII